MPNEFIVLLNKMYNEIFPTQEVFSQFEKRNKIYDYMVKNIKYNYIMLLKIIYNQICHSIGKPPKYKRNSSKEILELLENHKCICNSLAQVYKLLLEMAGIYSICIMCDEGSILYHQINLVKTGNTYSFDDVGSVILKAGTKKDYFNYDLEMAHKHKQGIRLIKNQGTYFRCFASNLIYKYINLDENGICYQDIKDPEYDEKSFHRLPLPQNIGKYQENTFIL